MLTPRCGICGCFPSASRQNKCDCGMLRLPLALFKGEIDIIESCEASIAGAHEQQPVDLVPEALAAPLKTSRLMCRLGLNAVGAGACE